MAPRQLKHIWGFRMERALRATLGYATALQGDQVNAHTWNTLF